MPRQSKIPVLRHHRPGGQAAVRIDGRDHYLGEHGSPESREKYDRLIALWLTRRRAPEPDPVEPVSVAVVEATLRFLSAPVAGPPVA